MCCSSTILGLLQSLPVSFIILLYRKLIILVRTHVRASRSFEFLGPQTLLRCRQLSTSAIIDINGKLPFRCRYRASLNGRGVFDLLNIFLGNLAPYLKALCGAHQAMASALSRFILGVRGKGASSFTFTLMLRMNMTPYTSQGRSYGGREAFTMVDATAPYFGVASPISPRGKLRCLARRQR